ncbi:MAG: hypothetical protein WAL59_07585 [Roseiarcus sp.]|jgi:hypothetical protein
MTKASTLFDVISFAGSMTLEELRARTSYSQDGLGQELSALLRNGRIEISPSGIGGPEDRVLNEIQAASHSKDAVESLPRILNAALSDERTSAAIMIIPTTQGYKFANS